ncbi:UNVERIFIED_CONTAM: Kinesin-like protein KIN-14F [Sesamum calycinum]|uniref:Kinesin-like protein KIN-14F n=1 Tax=Sesamum calycinum TaxID=2727403 RepID=A0AAW2MAR9_9LAMI
MDHGASEAMPKEPTEEDFRLALRNGLILCNVLNKVKPGAIRKVVETPVLDVQATEGAALYAIQYFENVRNFLVAVGRMKLLTFEASDLEKGGSSSKVVDCILCLRGYYEWKQSGGIGVWKYGGTVRIMSSPRDPPSSVVSSESADESLDDFESSQYEQLLEFLHLYTDSHEDSRAANILTFMFDYFSLGLLQAYLTETNGFDELALSPMAIDMVVRKVVKDFSVLLASQGNQLGLFLKEVLNTDCAPQTKSQFLEAISKYLSKRMSLVSRDISNFCICGGKGQGTMHLNNSNGSVELLDLQRKQLEDLKALFRETKQEVHQIQLGWEKELLWLGHHIKGLEVAASSFQKVLEENRVLFNQVQDMKGTIRVYCRVRPFLSGQSNGQSTVDYIGENGNIMIVNPQKQGKDARRVFSFNKVFGMNVTQYQIYAETQPLVRSVLDGYNVCIFAYGQTGSGKTYTMSGPNLTTEETWGVNYRALRDLFHISKARMDLIKYEVGVQMIEIYNEQVRDLLVTDGTRIWISLITYTLDIRNNSQLNGLNVPDASLIPVKCTEDVLDLMRVGQSNRAVGATALNERSSRSHSILTIHVRGKELVSGSILKGCLHLVDLAGSERVDRSEAVGERLKEAQHINRSLSALGDVIAALAQKSSYVPYRNSKLTQVLQDSLGGHAKHWFVLHINRRLMLLGEGQLAPLKFAERVAHIVGSLWQPVIWCTRVEKTLYWNSFIVVRTQVLQNYLMLLTKTKLQRREEQKSAIQIKLTLDSRIIIVCPDIVCNITVTWAKTIIGHSLYITVENPQDDNYYTCKIDLKTWQFWGKKGLKTFRVAEKRIDVFWDLRSAKFSDSPEPDSDYYVAMVSREELVLLLGDQQKEALRRTKSRLPSEDACLCTRRKSCLQEVLLHENNVRPGQGA